MFRSVTDTGRFIQVIVDGEDTVVIRTTELCWVEVADATGYLLYGDLNQSGDELEVIGAAPFQILLVKRALRRFVSMGKWSISSRIRPENLRQDSR